MQRKLSCEAPLLSTCFIILNQINLSIPKLKNFKINLKKSWINIGFCLINLSKIRWYGENVDIKLLLCYNELVKNKIVSNTKAGILRGVSVEREGLL